MKENLEIITPKKVAQQKYHPDDNTTIRPILSYTYYILIRIVQNKSTWIIFAISFIMTILFAVAPRMVGGSSAITLNVIAVIDVIAISIFSMLFGVIKSLNIFSDSQSDGTELIIVSKPITRTQLLITRFLFLLLIGLIFSLFMFIAWLIGLEIVGLHYYPNLTLSLVGVWLSSFITIMITSVISIFIAIRFSNKTARVLPLMIMSFSAILCIILAFLGSIFFNSTVPSDKLSSIFNIINENYSKRQEKDKFILTSKSSPIIITSFKPSFYDDSSSNNYNPFRITESKYSGDTIFYLQDIYAVSQNGSTHEFNVSSFGKSFTPYYGTKAEWKNIYNYINGQIGTILSDYSVAASGFTAINYLNPMSAFATIAGIVTSGSSNLFGSSLSTIFNWNFSYSNFAYSSNSVSISYNNYYNYEIIELPSAIVIKDVKQMDNPIYVGILWFSIFIGTMILAAAVYYRKNFK